MNAIMLRIKKGNYSFLNKVNELNTIFKPLSASERFLCYLLESDYFSTTGADSFSASSVMYFLKPSSVFHWSSSSPQTEKK